MAVFDLYSKRRRRATNGTSDVYSYESIPHPLRIQILHLWDEAIGFPFKTSDDWGDNDRIQKSYHSIAQILRQEYGLLSLAPNRDPSDKANARPELRAWLQAEEDTERVIDGIEVSFQVIDIYVRQQGYIRGRRNDQFATDAIDELNARFKEHALGYQFVDGMIIRVDSELLHQEAVLPALGILRRPEFANAKTEMLGAFEHFRHDNHAEALVDCLKAFESTMKVICDRRSWAYPVRATASQLVATILSNNLVPAFWQTHFAGLRSVLESGIPTPRNRQGGHGGGSGPAPNVPAELVSYVLHLTAATILYLAETDETLA